MADEYWFEPKKHGFGTAPSHWKGLVFLFGFMSLVPGGAVIITFGLGQTWVATFWA